jgi:hypothetical protein
VFSRLDLSGAELKREKNNMAHIIGITYEIIPTKKNCFQSIEKTKLSSGRIIDNILGTHLSLKAAQITCVDSMDSFCKFMGYKRTSKPISIDITKCGTFNFGE